MQRKIGDRSNLDCQRSDKSLPPWRGRLPAAALLALLLLPLLVAPEARGDRLILFDGRVVDGCRLERREGDLFALFEHGTLKLREDQIKEIFFDTDGAYVPADDFEKQQLEKGLVRFEGVWMSRERRQGIVDKRLKEREDRFEKARRRLDWNNAWRKETRHFTIVTNTSEDQLEEYCDLFDQFFDLFVKKWKISGKARGKYKKPVIKIYRSREQYVASGVPASSAGIFFPLQGELRCYWDAADPRYTLDVLFHEGTHLMVQLTRPGFFFPIWVNEGLAEYYGSSIVDANGRIVTGIVQEGRLAALRSAVAEGKYIPLESLLLTPQRGFGSLHYAEAWCFVHYLIEHDKYSSGFKSFFYALVTGTGIREQQSGGRRGGGQSGVSLGDTLDLFKKKMGIVKFDAIEREFMDYILYGLPDVGMRGYLVSARIHMRANRLDDAYHDIVRALEMGSADPRCHLYLGRIFTLQKRYERAAVAFQRAIQIDPLNPYFHAELGNSLVKSGDRFMRDEGIRELYLATEIAPDVSAFRSMLKKAKEVEKETKGKKDRVKETARTPKR